MAEECKILTKLVAKCNHPRVLYIDAYDSFANNIIHMLEKLLSAKVYVLKINPGMSAVEFARMVRDFDAVIAGPGPGSPTNPADVGIMNELWNLSEEDVRPALGISLGFQSLAYTFGATIQRLKDAKHGIVSQVVHGEESIFRGLSGIKVTRYHSLEVKLDPPDHPAYKEEYMLWDARLLWKPRAAIPNLQPLAWVVAEHKDDAILMAVRHVEKPFWGIQFHVDSAASDKESRKVISNWWAEVARWHQKRYGAWYWASSRAPHRIVMYLQRWLDRRERDLVFELPFERHMMNLLLARQWRDSRGPREVVTETLHWPWHSEEILKCVQVGYDGCDAVVLETAGSEHNSRYTIVGFVVPEDHTTIEYSTGAQEVKIVRHLHGSVNVDTWCLSNFNDDFWEFLCRYMSGLRNFYGREDSPFWGGLAGYVSHEMGLSSIGVDPPPVISFGERGQSQPDISFAFIERSVVLDHDLQMAYVQSLAPNDSVWIHGITETLADGPIGFSSFDEWSEEPSIIDRRFKASYRDGDMDVLEHPVGMQLSTINGGVYKRRVEQCRELILDGQSHGLCLTSQATMRLPRPRWRSHAWHMYRHMRQRNESPFGAFYNVGSTTIMSLSAERFLEIGPSGFQMQSTKGPLGAQLVPTEDELKRWRGEIKERAKQVTVVDVIRHDMLGVLGTGAVFVPQLGHLDVSPEGLHLSSVIEGNYIKPTELSEPMGCTQAENDSMRQYKQGYRLLGASLPPATSTGAPKKRSCEILRNLEGGKRRGIYSGVMGYLCISGRGGFSVLQRTATKWSHDQCRDWPVAPTPASAPVADPTSAPESTLAPEPTSAPEPTPAPESTPAYSFPPRARASAGVTASSICNTTTWSWGNIGGQPKGEHMLDSPGGKDKIKQAQHIGKPTGPFDYWRFGSSSTVTALSDPETDYQEMRDELDRTLGPFMTGLKQVALIANNFQDIGIF